MQSCYWCFSCRQWSFQITFDGFDSYAPGTVNPSPPWNISFDQSACWVPAGSSVANYPGALSAPNTYFIAYSQSGSGCSGTSHAAWMAIPINASGNVLTISAYFAFQSNTGGLTGLDNVQLAICPGSALPPGNGCSGSGTGVFSISAISPTSCTSNCWAKYTSSATVTPGSTYNAVIWVSTASGVSGFWFNVNNVAVKGGSPIVLGANVFLVNYNSKLWYNITGYSGSRVYVYYPNSIQAIYNNLPTPDIAATLTGSNLLTAWVGDSYSRSIIPNQVGKNTIYLDNPSVVLSYTFDIQDFTNTYLPGAQIYVALGSLTITSGYLDGQDSFTAWLQPANYTITLKSGANTYITHASISSSTTNPIPIQIATISHSLPVTGSNFNFDAGWDQNYQNLVVFYHDPNVDTSFIEVQVYNQTASGIQIMQDLSFTGLWGNFSVIFACSACKVANSQYIYVRLIVTNQYGTKYVFGTQPLAGGSLFANTPNPPDWGGIGSFFNSGSFNPWLELFGLCMLIGEAGLTGYYEAPAGFIILTISLTGLGLAGWIPVPAPIGGSLTLFAITAYMTRARDAPNG